MAFNKKYITDFNLSNESIKIYAENLEGEKNELILRIDGNIETLYSHAFGKAIIKTIKSCKDIQSIIFDFSKVNYLSSSGVGSIIHLLTIPERRDIEIYFLNINKKLQSVFKVLGFADLIQILNNSSFKTIFPLTVNCPDCQKENPCPKEGTYRCIYCNGIYIVSNKGIVKNQ